MRLIGSVLPEAAERRREVTFDDVGKRAIAHMEFTIEKVNWFSTYHVHHRVAAKFRQGRAFLLGDAAHIPSPAGGQGMNTGIGDAVNLSWKLSAVLEGGADDLLLDTYEPERIAFARRLVATTDRVFTLVTAHGAFAQWVRLNLVPRIMSVLFRFAAWRRFMFRTVSQIGIAYPDSRLSEGRAGRVRGGDRLPWVQTGPGCDNFDPLTALDWQVHVYGEVACDVTAACAVLRLPLHAFAWKPEMSPSGLSRGALYLIRPDGYVALAAAGDADRLRQYFTERGDMLRR